MQSWKKNLAIAACLLEIGAGTFFSPPVSSSQANCKVNKANEKAEKTEKIKEANETKETKEIKSTETKKAKEEQTILNYPLLLEMRGLAKFEDNKEGAEALEKIIGRVYDEGPEEKLFLYKAELQLYEMQIKDEFKRTIEDVDKSEEEIEKILRGFDKRRLRKRLDNFFKARLYWEGIHHLEDLEQASSEKLEKWKELYERIDNLEGLGLIEKRILIINYRYSDIKKLKKKKDKLERKITRIDQNELKAWERLWVEHYQRRLDNLDRQIKENKKLPYDKYRTLRGLRNGLKHIPYLMALCRKLDLDYKMMTRLLIQESDFIQERVSLAKAFSVGQLVEKLGLRDLWMNRKKIEGADDLLQGIEDLAQLKGRVIEDTETAIASSMLYFKFLLDGVKRDLKAAAGRYDLRVAYAIALAQYNGGRGNTLKAGRMQRPFGIPIKTRETRIFVDDILKGRDVLESIEEEIAGLRYASGKKIYKKIVKELLEDVD